MLMDYGEVRTARRKTQRDVYCAVEGEKNVYPVYELSAHGFSFLCPKDSYCFQTWETLSKIAIFTGDGQ